jgi:hypothetical protein
MLIKKSPSMDASRILFAFAILALLAISGCIGGATGGEGAATNITMVVYEGIGCPHCANTITLLNDIQKTYNFTLMLKEVRYNPDNNRELLGMYDRFGYDPAKGGIPTTIVNNRIMIVGELSRDSTMKLIGICQSSKCPVGAYTSAQMDELVKNIEQNANFSYDTELKLNQTANASVSPTKNPGDIPLMILVPAAVADSINPCTMAIMAMLLAITLEKKGKKSVLMSGAVFVTVIFICYFLMGLGVMKVVGDISIEKYFFYLMLAVSAAITLLEIRAYFSYHPGMESIEIPMFLRPRLQKVMQMATSLPMVAVVALFCSLFLLPCSSGPYLMILGMLSMTDMWTTAFFKAAGYLLLYNAIFVIPLLAITAIVAFGIRNPGDILSLRDKYVKQMHLVAGLLMLVVTAMLASFLFSSGLFR